MCAKSCLTELVHQILLSQIKCTKSYDRISAKCGPQNKCAKSGSHKKMFKVYNRISAKSGHSVYLYNKKNVLSV